MPGTQELELLEMICKGIDPRTGEVLDTPRDPILDKRRLAYLGAIRKMCRNTGNAEVANDGDHRGTRWSEVDNEQLRQLWLDEPLPTLDQVAKVMGRTPGAIAARLVKIALYPDRDAAREGSRLREARDK